MKLLRAIVPIVTLCPIFIAGCGSEKKAARTPEELQMEIKTMVNKKAALEKDNRNKEFKLRKDAIETEIKGKVSRVKENFDEIVLRSVRKACDDNPIVTKISGLNVLLLEIPPTYSRDGVIVLDCNYKSTEYEPKMESLRDLFNFIESKKFKVSVITHYSGWDLGYKIYATTPRGYFD